MDDDTESHSPQLSTVLVVGLGMVLIAVLAAVAAWVWSRRRPAIVQRRGRPRRLEATPGAPVAEA